MSKFTTGFSDGVALLATELNAIGDWTSYTPTLANWAIGNGTMSGAYIQIDKVVWFYAEAYFGTTSTYVGAPTITVPVNMETSQTHQDNIPNQFQVRCRDASGSAVISGTCQYSTTSVVTVGVWDSSGTYATYAALSSTVPITWTNTDFFSVAGWYRAA
jgi:hypothetical protein